MKNVWITVYDKEYEAHSNENKAKEYAKARLEEVRNVCADDDETNIVESADGASLMIRKADGRMIVVDVQVMKLEVK